ncbi:hypothetical protein HWV62_14638 [Athelia sp. TMB]|nr:hypothetical protein HWV62_14638 [Athelia sp. TMB]
MKPADFTVAVIGVGVAGLVTLKNLLEEGFNAQAFEGRDTIGGVWKFTDGDDHSVLESTVSNKSRYKNSFTDFPYPKDAPAFPTAPQVQEYLEAYAKSFDLLPHIHLQTRATLVKRNEADTKWAVYLHNPDGSETVVEFDKVVICRGEWGIPKMPAVEGRDIFEGKVIHSKAFKRPSDFAGKRVVVLGLGCTAADVATSLVGHASTIHIAHRRGANLLPRFIDGKPGDLALTRRLIDIKYGLSAVSPALSEKFFNTVIQSLTNKAFSLKKEWAIHPPPSFLTHQPTVSDNLASCLSDGTIISTPNIARFTGPSTVQFVDGTAVEADVVICCTGFTRDFSLVPALQPKVADAWSKLPNSDKQSLPRLFQNVFPVAHRDSIAFMNGFSYPTGFMWIADLASMAVAQVWKGTAALPAPAAMNKAIDAHHAWLVGLAEKDTVASDLVHEQSWLQWMHDAAGTGINENLGYGTTGLWHWAREPRLTSMIMGGVESPFVLRLFEGKRKAWEGARQAIVDINEEARAKGHL